jgi:hypothetical protein
MHRELNARRAQLEELAERPELRELIRGSAGKSHEELLALVEGRGEPGLLADEYRALNDWRTASDQRLAEGQRTPDQSWFVQDARGRQVFRQPSRKATGEPQATIGMASHWRDYFHGRGDDLPRDTPVGRVAARQSPGISAPFRSDATGQYMIALAVPVWDASREKVIGILARTIHLSELLSQWEETIRDTASAAGARDRFLALAAINSQARQITLLDHPWMQAERLGTYAKTEEELDELMSLLQFKPETAQKLLPLRNHPNRDYRDSVYRDPIADIDETYLGSWLAAFAPVEDTNWIAIVQERRDVALEPVGDLRDVFTRAGLWSLCIFGVLLAGLWYLINRASA